LSGVEEVAVGVVEGAGLRRGVGLIGAAMTGRMDVTGTVAANALKGEEGGRGSLEGKETTGVTPGGLRGVEGEEGIMSK